MKSRILSFAFIMVGLGSASLAEVNINSTWQEIMSSNRVVAGFPSIQFQNGSFFALDQVCTDGDHVYPLKQDNKICVEFQNVGNSGHCSRARDIKLYSPVIARQKVCLDFNEGGTCTRMVHREVDYSRTYNIGVYSVEGEAGMGGQPLFTKDYQIASCDDKDSKDDEKIEKDEKDHTKESQSEMSND